MTHVISVQYHITWAWLWFGFTEMPSILPVWCWTIWNILAFQKAQISRSSINMICLDSTPDKRSYCFLQKGPHDYVRAVCVGVRTRVCAGARPFVCVCVCVFVHVHSHVHGRVHPLWISVLDDNSKTLAQSITWVGERTISIWGGHLELQSHWSLNGLKKRYAFSGALYHMST